MAAVTIGNLLSMSWVVPVSLPSSVCFARGAVPLVQVPLVSPGVAHEPCCPQGLGSHTRDCITAPCFLFRSSW